MSVTFTIEDAPRKMVPFIEAYGFDPEEDDLNEVLVSEWPELNVSNITFQWIENVLGHKLETEYGYTGVLGRKQCADLLRSYMERHLEDFPRTSFDDRGLYTLKEFALLLIKALEEQKPVQYY